MNLEIKVDLTTTIPYANKGKTEDGSFILLKAPTTKNMSECSLLKKLFMQSAMSAQKENSNVEKESPGEEAETTASDVMQMIFAFGDAKNITSAMIAAKKLFKDVGQIEGEIDLTFPLIDQISIDDFENMLGEYFVNFTAASMLGN